MLQRVRSRSADESGFTLIELLVVILIIGILAAIAIPSFLNQRGKGEDASAKSNARTMQTAMETYYSDNNNYSCALTCVADLRAIEQQIPATGVSATGGTDEFTVTATSNSSNRTFSVTKAPTTGVVTRTCTIPTAGTSHGGCKITGTGTSGTW